MAKTKNYSSYNQLTKGFDVVVMTKDQIATLNKQGKFLVVLPKEDVDGSKEPTTREILLSIQKDIKELKQWKVNVDNMFKEHGWIKN